MKITRRNMLASSGAAFLTGVVAELGYSQETGEKEELAWKYVRLDPEFVARRAYEQFKVGGCLYGAFKGSVLAYAETVESSDPDAAKIARGIPFIVFRDVRAGFGKLRELCGALGGAILFVSAFCQDVADINATSAELAEYVRDSEQPEYVPENDECPDMFRYVGNALTCKVLALEWAEKAPEEQGKELIPEHCARLTASIARKAAELLNARFAEESAEE